MTNFDWVAWCVGVFDCRGTIGMSRARSGRYKMMVRAEGTCREKIERLQLILGKGTGTVRQCGPRPGKQPSWIWYCETSEQVRILRLMEPHLEEKRHDARLALEFLENHDLTSTQQDSIYQALQRSKPKLRNRHRQSAKVIEMRRA